MAEENTPETGATPDEAPLAERDPEAGDPASEAPEGAAGSGSTKGMTPGQRLAAKKAAKAVDKREAKDERRRAEEEKRQKEQEEADRLLGRAPAQPVLPAEVEKAATTFSDFLQSNRERILVGVVAAVVLAGTAFGVQHFMRSGSAEQATELARAVELANAPLDPEDTDGKTDDGKPVFKNEQERANKALAAFDQAAGAGKADGAAAVWAKLASASELVALGKYDDARTRFQGVYDAHAKQPDVAARALEGVGIALEAAGKRDEALKAFEKLKYVEGAKPFSEFHVARLKLASGDREGGKTMLKSLYDELSTTAPGEAPSTYLRSEVEVRLAEIDSSLVDKGSAGGAGDFGGGGGGGSQLTEQQIQKLLEQLQKNGGKPPAGE